MSFIEFLQYVGSEWGIAAIFAIIMVWLYRNAVKQMDLARRDSEQRLVVECNRSEERLRADRKFMEDRLSEVLSDYNQAMTANNNITSENTSTLRELKSWLQGHSNGLRD